jgi:type IV pilus assembly protein PilX
MLTQHSHRRAMQPRARQTGVVLAITLIVLVAMTLAAIALVRSVDTTNVIAGNLAFKQATVNAADRGTEAAVAWLETTTATNVNLLINDNFPNGYKASEQHPSTGVSWDSYWNSTIIPSGLNVCAPTNCNPDAAGNIVSYTINRLCGGPGQSGAFGSDCSYSPSTYILNTSQGSGTVVLNSYSQVYYRITIRVQGPRNTVSYVQTVVAD